MANIEKMKEEFYKMHKALESASMVREWQNGARNVNLSENLKARKQMLDGYKKRFEAAASEEATPEA
ncbi:MULTISPECIES: hypothetical protein [Bacillus]|uniref:hypothetical protein n=1 Tax=Bacillus TaxID=1386 RepID=UPI0009B793AC|nr:MULTISPECIES: hypothetical protein [Bacillus]ARC67315.1 hypothetical protein B14_200104 [Bacillus licheniformis]MCY1628314.1 hypothetical protein [Bacillus paralicheniformis]MCY8577605.1 hypothetical protein [Bacillus haynesii]MDE1421968.1 hypothetical protein [Bacillus licheniformis]MEC0475973.1 hypothetical protein [Bacillus licheniformis]